MTRGEPTVFIVDDDDAVRDSLAASLQTKGMAVECFPSAEAFLAAYEPGTPGCLVLDVRMPGLSGLELQEELNARQVSVPIIFISGHGDVPMSVQALKAGAFDFLEKPFRKEQLRHCIVEALAADARARAGDEEKAVLAARIDRLSPREKQVMGLVVAGYTNKEIAAQLETSHRTIDVYRAQVMEKMAARSLPELVAMAMQTGEYVPRD